MFAVFLISPLNNNDYLRRVYSSGTVPTNKVIFVGTVGIFIVNMFAQSASMFVQISAYEIKGEQNVKLTNQDSWMKPEEWHKT